MPPPAEKTYQSAAFSKPCCWASASVGLTSNGQAMRRSRPFSLPAAAANNFRRPKSARLIPSAHGSSTGWKRQPTQPSAAVHRRRRGAACAAERAVALGGAAGGLPAVAEPGANGRPARRAARLGGLQRALNARRRCCADQRSSAARSCDAAAATRRTADGHRRAAIRRAAAASAGPSRDSGSTQWPLTADARVWRRRLGDAAARGRSQCWLRALCSASGSCGGGA